MTIPCINMDVRENSVEAISPLTGFVSVYDLTPDIRLPYISFEDFTRFNEWRVQHRRPSHGRLDTLYNSIGEYVEKVSVQRGMNMGFVFDVHKGTNDEWLGLSADAVVQIGNAVGEGRLALPRVGPLGRYFLWDLADKIEADVKAIHEDTAARLSTKNSQED